MPILKLLTFSVHCNQIAVLASTRALWHCAAKLYLQLLLTAFTVKCTHYAHVCTTSLISQIIPRFSALAWLHQSFFNYASFHAAYYLTLTLSTWSACWRLGLVSERTLSAGSGLLTSGSIISHHIHRGGEQLTWTRTANAGLLDGNSNGIRQSAYVHCPKRR